VAIIKEELQGKVLAELQQIAESMGMTGTKSLRKADLIGAIMDRANGGGKPSPAKERASGNGEAPARAEMPAAQPSEQPEAPAQPAAQAPAANVTATPARFDASLILTVKNKSSTTARTLRGAPLGMDMRLD